MITLFCLVNGDPVSNAFPVRVSETDLVGDIKKLIKEEKQNDFHNIDADKLTLWAVSVAVDTDAVNALVLRDEDKLLPTDDITDRFPAPPPKKRIHIIVKRPSRGTKRRRSESSDDSEIGGVTPDGSIFDSQGPSKRGGKKFNGLKKLRDYLAGHYRTLSTHNGHIKEMQYIRHCVRMIRWGVFRLSVLRGKTTPSSLDIPNDIKTELPRNIIAFRKPPRLRLDHGCVDILLQNILRYHDDDRGTARLSDMIRDFAPAIQQFCDNQPAESPALTIQNPRIVAVLDTIMNFRLPIQFDSIIQTSESFFSHQFWAPILTSVVREARLECNWEVLCREGQENGKGRMSADFGAYTIIGGKPCYTILAELERGDPDDVVHKDFVVIVAEMRLLLEKAVERVSIERIGELRIYGLLLSRTSAKLLVMGAAYDQQLEELVFVLDEDVATYDLDPTRSPQELIEDIVDLFSLFEMVAGVDATGISDERFNEPGQRINIKAIPGLPHYSEVSRQGSKYTPSTQRGKTFEFSPCPEGDVDHEMDHCVDSICTTCGK